MNQNMFTTPQYPYQYVYPFSQIPNPNSYYFPHMKRVPYQTHHQPYISTLNQQQQQQQATNSMSNPSTLQPNPSPSIIQSTSTTSTNIPIGSNGNQSSIIDQSQNIDTYFNFASSPPRKSK